MTAEFEDLKKQLALAKLSKIKKVVPSEEEKWEEFEEDSIEKEGTLVD